MTGAVRVGIAPNEALLVPGTARRDLLARAADAGLDHVTVGDHVSFHDGAGFDGGVAATAALATDDRLDVLIGVYLAALRHPLLVSRMLSTIALLAPGRLVLGVGVGGEDRLEVSNSGVDPATRGRRLDESLTVLRALAGGEPVDHEGEFFTLRTAAVRPAPSPAVPIVVGGGGEAAVRRTARHGDGWLGMFCSARRYGETVGRIHDEAAALDRPAPSWFGLSQWVGIGPSSDVARGLLGERMAALYRVPAERFRHVTSAGTAADVAEQLAPFVAAGARHLTLVPVAATAEEAVEQCGEVRRLLLAGLGEEVAS